MEHKMQKQIGILIKIAILALVIGVVNTLIHPEETIWLEVGRALWMATTLVLISYFMISGKRKNKNAPANRAFFMSYVFYCAFNASSP